MKLSRQTFFSATIVAVSSFLLFSCKVKEEAGPSISVKPSSLILQYNAGDLIEFDIEAQGGDHNLRQIRIAQKPEGGITSVLLDTLISGSEADFFFVYQVPVGNSRILLTFIAIDTEGNDVTSARDLYVNQGDFLTETSGYTLYSPYYSGSNNAFNINSLSYLQMDADPDSALVDLIEFDNVDDSIQSGNLRSLSGVRFVRNNAFNYAQATASGAADTYTSSVPQEIILDIQQDDILIAEYDTIQHLYAVIRFTGVYDEPGQNQDRYIFNVKR